MKQMYSVYYVHFYKLNYFKYFDKQTNKLFHPTFIIKDEQ